MKSFRGFPLVSAACLFLCIGAQQLAADENIRLVVESPGSIEGKIIVEGGSQPPPAARVWLQTGGIGYYASNLRGPVPCGADGTFRISGVPAGSYRVQASFEPDAVGGWVADRVPVTVKAGQTARGVQVTAGRGGWLEVVVRQPNDHKPPGHASVNANREQFQAAADCDSNGIALLRVPPGKYQVLAFSGSAPAYQHPASVETGKTNRVEIEIGKPPEMPGVARQQGGQPPAGPPGGTKEAVTTRFVPAGAKVTLDMDRPEYFIGENVAVHFTLENTGDQPFAAEFGGDYRGASRSTRFKVTATDEQGRTAEDPDPSPMCWGGLINRRVLKPGEKFTQSLPLMRYCQIDRPGRYTIRVTHDYGWSEVDRKRPAGETAVTFRVPTPAEAETVITEMEKAHDNAGFAGLCLPVYLEPLLRRARAGDRQAIAGISRMATPDATAALIELAGNSDTNLALDAATALNARLPDPALESAAGFGGYGGFSKEARRRLVTNSWDARFAPAVRSLATNFLARSQTSEIIAGAFMVRAVGTPAEADAVISALGRALGPMVNARHDPKDDILDQPQPLRELIMAMDVLHKHGYTLPEGEGARYLTVAPGVEWDKQGRSLQATALNGEADLLLYFTWLANTPGPRSDRWLELVKAYGPSTRFPTRVAILNSIPQPMPDACVAFVEGRLQDADLGVCRAACAAAGESGRKVFLRPLLDIIATEHHEWLLREASAAARKLGAGFDLLDDWADRLADEGLFGVALDNLQGVVDGLPNGWSGRTDLSRSERIELRLQWKNFLARHAAEIRLGKKFKLDDPALTPELFGRARTFRLPNGKTWPGPRTELY